MAACPACGEPYPYDASFCRMCGRRRDTDTNQMRPMEASGSAPQFGYTPSPGPQFGFGNTEASRIAPPRVIGGGISGYGAASPGISGYGAASPAPSALSALPPPGSYPPQYAPPVGTPGPLSRSYVPPPASQARLDPYRSGVPDYLEKGGYSSYPSFVAPAPSGGVIVDGYRQYEQGEAWESGGYRYRLGDRYALDGEGRGRYASAGYGQAPERSVPAHRGAGAGYPGAGAGYPGGYPGVSTAYGNYDHMHDSYGVHELPPHQQYHGPMPPPSAPGTISALPPYMHENEKGQRKAKKKDKKDGKKKKGAGCC